MPARKSAAPAKKAAAKKTAAPAKKTAAKKSTSASKPAAGKGDSLEGLAKNIAEAIRSGQFDGHVAMLDEAITERVNAKVAENAKTERAAAKKTETKKVSAAPKRGATKKSEPITPKEGTTYKLSGPAKLAGAKVKFLRFKSDDDKKAVVEMVTGKPGYPKEKRVVVPVSALAPSTR